MCSCISNTPSLVPFGSASRQRGMPPRVQARVSQCGHGVKRGPLKGYGGRRGTDWAARFGAGGETGNRCVVEAPGDPCGKSKDVAGGTATGLSLSTGSARQEIHIVGEPCGNPDDDQNPSVPGKDPPPCPFSETAPT
jgi:hypothetical protein